MREIIEEVEQRREQARLGGGQKRIDAQHAKGKLTARERLDVLLDEGSFEEYDMYKTHRCTDFGMEETGVSGRWRDHRLGHHQRPPGLCVQPGFHRVRRLAVGDPCGEDLQGDGSRRAERRAADRLNDSGGARIQEGVASLGGYAEVFWRNVQASGVVPQISVIMGPVRGRGGLFAGDDRLHLHGEGHELHVRHRPGRGEDRDQRDRHGGRTGRRVDPYEEVLGRRRSLRQRRRGADRDPPDVRFPAAVEPRKPAGIPTADAPGTGSRTRSTR
jgi:hypothetical protein